MSSASQEVDAINIGFNNFPVMHPRLWTLLVHGTNMEGGLLNMLGGGT
ncbi:predicted protein [Plenodomus lingam JN3]|uniref:Predicted protein n=1 Tax=Leptosphaeria maculans (strain JN3 / isolate v23.1.3 / race Av1-4-5-6-7-8) TaxID=985895 RepID=E4ZQZ2_LEPMJ|nr:predicted protein [Plenodomus lingam JN3]CBX93657.1 predicted protein [Plenodomus lingam JN3]